MLKLMRNVKLRRAQAHFLDCCFVEHPRQESIVENQADDSSYPAYSAKHRTSLYGRRR